MSYGFVACQAAAGRVVLRPGFQGQLGPEATGELRRKARLHGTAFGLLVAEGHSHAVFWFDGRSHSGNCPRTAPHA